MKIIIGSSFCLLGLAVILNSIELSTQSSTPRRQGPGAGFPAIFARQGFRPGYTPFRKVRCPRPDQVTLHSSFMMKNENGFYVECTPDKILLALGSTIFGQILNGRIHPISGFRGTEIIYDEAEDKQVVAGVDWLEQHVGLYKPVPPEVLRAPQIYAFGAFRENSGRRSTRDREPTRPTEPTRPNNQDEVVDPYVDSVFGSESDTSSTSSLSRSSSFASSRPSRPGSPRK